MRYIFLLLIPILLFFLLFKSSEKFTNDYLHYLSAAREIHSGGGDRCLDLSDKSILHCEARKKKLN